MYLDISVLLIGQPPYSSLRTDVEADERGSQSTRLR
jgi:hypothetical protein